jgi:hypothetical protein
MIVGREFGARMQLASAIGVERTAIRWLDSAARFEHEVDVAVGETHRRFETWSMVKSAASINCARRIARVAIVQTRVALCVPLRVHAALRSLNGA